MGPDLARRSLLRGSLALIVLATAPGVSPAQHARTPWTTSRMMGTPEPPRPYAIEPAFRKLTFDRPLALAAIPGTKRLVVAEFGGTIRSFPDDQAVDRSDLVVDLAKARPGFSSLFGIAFHPRFVENRQVYLCYVLKNETPDGTRVSRFTMTRGDAPTIDPASEKVLLTFPSGGHNGGCLQFGNDGYLYISTGDAASPAPPDPLATGQDLSDLLSSILRIDVNRTDDGKPYRIPPDNPFVKTPGARPEVWAYGFRNPWRMSFDRATGDLWVGDVGWELWEMIHRVERGGNYGWSITEGHQPVRPDGKRGPTPIVPPIVEHPHSEAASITGGYVYRGSRFKDLVGTYVYGDFQSGKVWGLRYENGKVTARSELADSGLRLVSFGEDDAGEIYLLEYERTNRIYRLVPNPAKAPDRAFPKLLSETGLFASTPDHRPAPGVVPYNINAQAWDDGTNAQRFLAIPGTGRIEVTPGGGWNVPDGSVLARTVSIDLVNGDPATRRKIETQILHREDGTWRPYTYAWDDAQRDANLVEPGGLTKPLTIADKGAPGGHRSLDYRIAARSECLTCHNPWAGSQSANFGRQSASPLALNTAQIDRKGDNQIAWLNDRGYFTKAPSEGERAKGKLANPYDETEPLDARARSYLQVNCAHCHQANAGGTTTISLLASLGIDQTKTVDLPPIQGMFGITDARIIAPGEPDRSVLFYRIAKTGAGRMPRIGSQHVDAEGARLIADWIAGMSPLADTSHRLATGDMQALQRLKATSGSGPILKADALLHLTRSTRGALALVREIDRGTIPESVVGRLGKRLSAAPPEVRDLFERFLPDRDRIKRLGTSIDPAAILSLAGDPERGRALFFAEAVTQCKSCHRVGDAGTALGPELDAIGKKYARADLLRHILEPSREIEPKFATHVVATKDGQIHTGVIGETTAELLVLRDAKGQPITIRSADIEQQEIRKISLMPEGLLRDLTAQQAADLLEYLATRKGR